MGWGKIEPKMKNDGVFIFEIVAVRRAFISRSTDTPAISAEGKRKVRNIIMG